MKNNISEPIIRMIFVRLALDLSQARLAELMGYSVSYVKKVETGSRPLTVSYLRAFCLATGVSADYILFAEVKMPKDEQNAL